LEKSLKKPVRQGNFELLRIVAMVMIVTLHYLGKGKLLDIDDTRVTYYFAWACEALSICAVNVYVLISGYFITSKKFKLNKIIDLWVQTALISVCTYIFAIKAGIAKPDDTAMFYKSFFPITRSSYWFITTYFVFCAIAPFLVHIVNMIDQRQHKTVCVSLVFITSVLPSIFFSADWVRISKGYHIMWFITLFFVASYIRKYDTFKKNPIIYFLAYAVSSLFGLLIKLVIKHCYKLADAEDNSDSFFMHYHMFFVFLAAVFLFLAFKNITINGTVINKIIRFFSSATIYVYIIHEAPSIRMYLWEEIVSPLSHLGIPDIIINYVVGIGGVYLVCTLIGAALNAAYNLLQLPRLTLRISDAFAKVFGKMFTEKIEEK